MGRVAVKEMSRKFEFLLDFVLGSCVILGKVFNFFGWLFFGVKCRWRIFISFVL